MGIVMHISTKTLSEEVLIAVDKSREIKLFGLSSDIKGGRYLLYSTFMRQNSVFISDDFFNYFLGLLSQTLNRL